MTDRLRKLDALFAEKVLGAVCTRVITDAHAYVAWKQPNDEVDLPRYTRSLDAAWQATNDKEFCCREVFSDYNYVHRARVETEESHGQDEPQFTGQSMDHPAEALVLACLRAVGVDPDGE